VKGAFGTFRFFGKLRHFGRKGIPEYVNNPEAPKSDFEVLGCFVENHII